MPGPRRRTAVVQLSIPFPPSAQISDGKDSVTWCDRFASPKQLSTYCPAADGVNRDEHVRIAMGPVGITMSYMPIAQALPPEMRRPLARRTILVGFMVALVLMLLGDGVIQGLHLSPAVLLLGVGVTYFVQALPMLLAGSSDLSAPADIKEPRGLAISPL